MAEVATIKDNGRRRVSINPLDIKKHKAAVESVTFASSNTEVATVTPVEGDPLSADIDGVAPGDVTISVSADAQIGEGESILAGTVDLKCIPGAASSIELTLGDETDQPAV